MDGWMERGLGDLMLLKVVELLYTGEKVPWKIPAYFIMRKWTEPSAAFLFFLLVKKKCFRQEEVKTHLEAEMLKRKNRS